MTCLKITHLRLLDVHVFSCEKVVRVVYSDNDSYNNVIPGQGCRTHDWRKVNYC